MPPAGLDASPASRRTLPLVFWLLVVRETLTSRDAGRLVRARLSPNRVRVLGAERLPLAGPVVLAANHYGAAHAFDAIAAIALACEQVRPGVLTELALIMGVRAPRRQSMLARWSRALTGHALDRWGRQLLRIPLDNRQASVWALRRWRDVAAQRPTLVFPEGRASTRMGEVRSGSGRWLATLAAPTLPVGVWREPTGDWVVSIGQPIGWARDPELHDLQVGLNIANQLPRALAGNWHARLGRWLGASRADFG